MLQKTAISRDFVSDGGVWKNILSENGGSNRRMDNIA